MGQSSSSKTIIFTVATLTVAAATYLCWDSFFKDKPEDTPKKKVEQKAPEENIIKVNPGPQPLPESSLPSPTPEEEAAELGMNMDFTDPRGLVAKLTEQLNNVESDQDIEAIAKLLGNGKVNQDHLQQLQKLFAENRLKLSDEATMQLLGEIKAGQKSRWAINLKDGSKMQLDIGRQRDGKWKVEDVRLPMSNIGADGKPLSPEAILKRRLEAEQKDAMNYTHNFMTVLTSLDFEKARGMVNTDKISDAKIAGLCILFEDGNYQIDQSKPLQAIRLKEDISAFYANVISNDAADKKGAQFSITAVRDSKDKPWKVDEINLDRLLEDYANRVAGGDVYYSPLISNPDGGDTLVIYFEFDSEGLTERTQKQLDIVARLLKLDKRKKVTLSGHTDAKGSDEYNQGLSKERAKAVMAYLRKIGVAETQIATEGHGFSKPRRPGTKKDGTDDPSGRRANRRTEIYLDF